MRNQKDIVDVEPMDLWTNRIASEKERSKGTERQKSEEKDGGEKKAEMRERERRRE